MFKSLLGSLALLILTPFSYSASFDCAKAGTAIEKKVCQIDELSRLDEQLAETYKNTRASVPENISKKVRIKQRAWLKQRNANCSNAGLACLTASYSNQIDYLKRLTATIKALNKFSKSLNPTTLKFLDRSDIGRATTEARFAYEDFVNSNIFTALPESDRKLITNPWVKGNAIVTINADFNNDFLVDSFVYQSQGTGNCLRPFLLLRQPDLSLKVASGSHRLPSGSDFCNTSVMAMGIGNQRWLGSIEKHRTSGGRLSLYAGFEGSFEGNEEANHYVSCTMHFNSQVALKSPRHIPYHKEFSWLFNAKTFAKLEQAVNNKTRSEFALSTLEKIEIKTPKAPKSTRYMLDINGDGIVELFKTVDEILHIKKGDKFVKLNEYWQLEGVAEKYDSVTSYNTLNQFDPYYLFFTGEDQQPYMIYWSNGEIGWRQSQYQVMFLYRLGAPKPEFIDSLLLEPEPTYTPDGISCN